MPIQKSQLLRLKHISARLKENRYPNSKTLTSDFKKMDLEENIPIACTEKTVLRDMQVLKNDFGCPLGFDRSQNGYYLRHHGWDFISPALLDDNEMLAAVIGARIAENIFPAPLKNSIRNAVDFLLQNNNPDFLDTANMQSLNILSGLFSNLDSGVFMAIFDAWEKHYCVRILYSDYSGKVTERIFEPHTLVFYENAWYSKGFCRLKKAPRTFAVQRITRAEKLPHLDFEQSKSIIDSVNMDDFLNFMKIKNVKLRVSDQVKERLLVSPLHSCQKIEGEVVTLPAVAEETLFPFLLSQRGGAVLLEPEDLRNKYKKELQKMLGQY